MKSFRHYLKESSEPGAPQTVDLSNLLGALRLAGIDAGERDSLTPFVASKGIMGLSTAANKIQDVLRAYGYLMGNPSDVVHQTDKMVRMTFPLYSVNDETRKIGDLLVNGELSPVDKTTMKFRADFKFSQDYLF